MVSDQDTSDRAAVGDEEARAVHRHALDRIAGAEVQTDPFPHVIIDQLLPPAFYGELLRHFPDRSAFELVAYPGTGHGKSTSKYHEHGLAYRRMAGHPYFRVVHDLFGSEEFSRALLAKFSRPVPGFGPPIPPDKHALFADGARDFTPVYDFQIDLPGYEIPPHPDVPDKIVTFQLFLTDDDSVRDFGTIFLKARKGDGGVARRSAVAEAVGAVLEWSMGVTRLRWRRPYRRLEQSSFGLWAGIGTTRNWLPWDLFEIKKIAPALPNHFMAFAPNAVSYHAVRMNIPPTCPRQERPVVRGFIRKGRSAQNFISPVKM